MQLRIDQLLAAAELTGCDVVLNAGDDHGMIFQGSDAGGFGDHPGLYDLGLDLTEAGLQAVLTCTLRIKMPAGRISGFTTSPGRRKNCSTRPSTPARITVLSRSTCA